MTQYLLSVHSAADAGAQPAEPTNPEQMQQSYQQTQALEEDMKAAGAWLFSGRLTEPDVATVVYHSVFFQYLTEGSRRRITAALDLAVTRAAPEAPVYHLRMEPDPVAPGFEVRLGDELLATSAAHGAGVRWLAS